MKILQLYNYMTKRSSHFMNSCFIYAIECWFLTFTSTDDSAHQSEMVKMLLISHMKFRKSWRVWRCGYLPTRSKTKSLVIVCYTETDHEAVQREDHWHIKNILANLKKIVRKLRVLQLIIVLRFLMMSEVIMS